MRLLTIVIRAIVSSDGNTRFRHIPIGRLGDQRHGPEILGLDRRPTHSLPHGSSFACANPFERVQLVPESADNRPATTLGFGIVGLLSPFFAEIPMS